MILVDSSAWIEFINGLQGFATTTIRDNLGRDRLAITEVVVLEVLAGVRSHSAAVNIRRLLLSCRMLSASDLIAYEEAAALYRTCRQAGVTPRALNDCLVAVAAIRAGASVLHNDKDFELIALHTDLLTEPLD